MTRYLVFAVRSVHGVEARFRKFVVDDNQPLAERLRADLDQPSRGQRGEIVTTVVSSIADLDKAVA